MKNFRKLNGLILLFIPCLFTGMILEPSKINNSTDKTSNLNNKANEKNYTVEEVQLGNSITNSFGGAIINNGTNDVLYMWGDNAYGQLGTGDIIKQNQPVAIDINGNGDPYDEGDLSSLTLGENFGGVVVNNSIFGDQLYTWGNNDQGQLGDGTTYERLSPIKVNNAKKTIEIKDLSFYNESAQALVTNDGTDEIYTWGFNTNGQLGLGFTSDRVLTPQKVEITESYESISHISNNDLTMSIVLSTSGESDKLVVWGEGSSGVFGEGSGSTYLTPHLIDVQGITGFEGTITQLSGQRSASGFVIDDGEFDHLFVSGTNLEGNLGLGEDIMIVNTWTEVEPDKDLASGAISDLSMRFGNSTSVVVNNQLYTFGLNDKGQLGLGDREKNKEYFPVLVDTSNIEGEITQLITGGKSLMILVDDGVNQQIYSTGDNNDNQLALNKSTSSFNTLQKSLISSYNPNININQVTVNTTSDSAEIVYSFAMNGAIVDSIDLQDNSDESIVATNTDSIIDENGNVIGSFELTGLNTDTDYSYNLLINYHRPGTTDASITSVKVDFKTKASGEITLPTVIINNSSTGNTKTTAAFNVLTTSGQDASGATYTFVSYKVFDDNGNEINSNRITTNGNDYIISDLETDTTYNNWTVETVWSDSSDGKANTVVTSEMPRFKTAPYDIIDPSLTINFLNSSALSINNAEATFNVTVNNGQTGNGTAWNFESYKLDVGAISPKPEVIENEDGSYTLTNLTPNTTYTTGEIKVVSTFWNQTHSSKKVITTEINEFSTEEFIVIEPTLTTDFISNTETTATFNAETDNGLAESGYEYKIKGFNVFDENNNQIPNDEVIDNGDGTYTLINLAPKTDFNNYDVNLFYIDDHTSGSTYQSTQFALDPFTTVINNQAIWPYFLYTLIAIIAVIGISAGIWFFVL